MTRDKALALLEKLGADLHEQFPDASARLEQLDSHLGTVQMVIAHLYDESARIKVGIDEPV